MEKQLYIFADKEIFKVHSLDGNMIFVTDKTGWGNSIPLSRVERFCDEKGNHVNYQIIIEI